MERLCQVGTEATLRFVRGVASAFRGWIEVTEKVGRFDDESR